MTVQDKRAPYPRIAADSDSANAVSRQQQMDPSEGSQPFVFHSTPRQRMISLLQSSHSILLRSEPSTRNIFPILTRHRADLIIEVAGNNQGG